MTDYYSLTGRHYTPLREGSREWRRWYRRAVRLLARLEAQQEKNLRRQHKTVPKHRRPKCGARCRSGKPCRAPAVWDGELDGPRNGRCRLHGGLATGPRTEAGRRRVAEAARRRAQARRELTGRAPSNRRRSKPRKEDLRLAEIARRFAGDDTWRREYAAMAARERARPRRAPGAQPE